MHTYIEYCMHNNNDIVYNIKNIILIGIIYDYGLTDFSLLFFIFIKQNKTLLKPSEYTIYI